MPTLLTLPAEIRNRIWEYATQADYSIALPCKPIGITQVNRQIRNETRAMYLALNTFETGYVGDAIMWLLVLGTEACASVNDLVFAGPLMYYLLDENTGPRPSNCFIQDLVKFETDGFEFLGWHPAFSALRVAACRLRDPAPMLKNFPTEAQRTRHHLIMQRARTRSQETIRGMILACIASSFDPTRLVWGSRENQVCQLVLHFEEHVDRVWEEAKSSAWKGIVSFPVAAGRFPTWLGVAIRDWEIEVVGFLFLTLCVALFSLPAVATICFIMACLSLMR